MRIRLLFLLASVLGTFGPAIAQEATYVQATDSTSYADQTMPNHAAAHAFGHTVQTFQTAAGRSGRLFSLPRLGSAAMASVVSAAAFISRS